MGGEDDGRAAATGGSDSRADAASETGVNTAAGTRYYDADDVPASLWTSVVAVRLWLLARSADAEGGYSNTSTYTMGDQTVTAADGYRRQVFPLVVQIRK